MQFCRQAACGECPAHPGASLLDGATCGLGDPRHHLPFPGLAPGLEWCGPVFWPHGGQGPALPIWGVPPAGLSCLWPAGQTPGAWWAGVGGGGRTTGCCQGKKEQGLWLSCWLFWDPCVPGVHTARGGACLSPAARGQSYPGCRRRRGSPRSRRRQSRVTPCATNAGRCWPQRCGRTVSASDARARGPAVDRRRPARGTAFSPSSLQLSLGWGWGPFGPAEHLGPGPWGLGGWQRGCGWGAISPGCLSQMTTWVLARTARACRPRLRNISFTRGLGIRGFLVESGGQPDSLPGGRARGWVG